MTREEAIKAIKTWDFLDNDEKKVIETLIPELKESEDERIRKMIINHLTQERGSLSNKDATDAIKWIEKQVDKDKLIKELSKYKVKYTQEILQNYLNSMSNKNDERLRKTTIAFLKEFADKGYENVVECIDWLEIQGNTSKEVTCTQEVEVGNGNIKALVTEKLDIKEEQ